MKTLGVLFVLGFVVGAAWWYHGPGKEWRERRRMVAAMWTVQPIQLPDGTRQIWLVRLGESDFLYAEVVPRNGVIDEDEWGDLLAAASNVATQYDRIHKVLSEHGK